jgi:riboflavin synthase
MPRSRVADPRAAGYDPALKQAEPAAMFTGIVTDVGKIERIERAADLRARLRCDYPAASIALGASIACDGVCLTVVDRGPAEGGAWFDVDISAETLARTNIGTGPTAWTVGAAVNLERALRLGDELGGHIVTGHVDGLAEVTAVRPEGGSVRVSFRAPEGLARFIASKGSIALNGTSLTVNEVDGTSFGVNLIPHTLAHTTWGRVRQGDLVNVEIDTLARYVARLAEFAAA